MVLTEKLLLRRSVLGEYQLGAEEAFSNAQAAFSDQDFVTTMSSEEGVPSLLVFFMSYSAVSFDRHCI